MIDYYPQMNPAEYYHVFNRGNNRENIFYKPRNAIYFLLQYHKYLSPLLDTYAYCLLPNHFHLLVRVKSVEEILGGGACTDIPGFKNLECLAKRGDSIALDKAISEMVSEQFRRFFISYAKAINKQEGRVGSLFQKNFKRLRIKSKQHLINLVQYIHANAQLHGLCDDFRDWSDSSYHGFLSENPTNLQRAVVLDWFGNREQFILRHREYIGWKIAEEWLIEE